MSDNLNPLEIHSVLQLVLYHVNPPEYLLSCRLVNRTWYRFATHQLNSEGWSIHLRSGSHIREYLRLLKVAAAHQVPAGMAVEPEASGASSIAPYREETAARTRLYLRPIRMKVPPPNDKKLLELDVCLHTMSPSKRRNEALDAAIKLVRDSGVNVKVLECCLRMDGVESRLWRLIKLTSSHLRYLTLGLPCTVSLQEEEDDVQMNQMIPALVQQEDFQTQTLEFPVLISLGFDFSGQWGWYYNLGVDGCILVKKILASAPRLNYFKCTIPTTMPPFNISPVHMFELLDGTSEPRGPRRIEWIQNLVQLDATLENLCWVRILQRYQFTQLRTLRISIRDADCSNTSAWVHILQYIDNCPLLTSIQVTYIVPSTRPDRNGDLLSVVPPWEGAPAMLTRVTHYGFKVFHPTPIMAIPIVFHKILLGTKHLLHMMHRFPNLVAVTMNLKMCISLVTLHNHLQYPRGEVVRAQVFGDATWPNVTELKMSVSQYVLLQSGPALSGVADLLNQMFPNLNDLVIELGEEDQVTWKPSKDMGYILGLVFGLKVLRKAEIHNYSAAWNISSAAPAMTDRNENEGSPCQLQTLSIRGVPRFMARELMDMDTSISMEDISKLNLDNLLAQIPDEFKSGLELRIEAGLLLQPYQDLSCDRRPSRDESFTILWNRLKAWRSPRISLF